MPIPVTCACGKKYMFKDEFAGRRAKCPACGAVISVPGHRVGQALEGLPQTPPSPSILHVVVDRRRTASNDPTYISKMAQPKTSWIPLCAGIALCLLSVLLLNLASGQETRTLGEKSLLSTATGEKSDEAPMAIGSLLLSSGLITLWVLPVVWGVKWARYKGVSPHWMWFGIHPLGGWIAFAVIRLRAERVSCRNCGGALTPKLAFCPQCGTSTAGGTALTPIVASTTISTVPHATSLGSAVPSAPSLSLTSPPPLPPPVMGFQPAVGETTPRWRVIRRLVEQRIQEQLGSSEDVLAMVATRKGHWVLAIIFTLLLFPVTLLLIGLFIIPGLIWLVYLGVRQFGKITKAGGSGADVILLVILSFFIGLLPGCCGLIFWVLCPIFGIKTSFVVRTLHYIVMIRFRPIFMVPTLTSVSVLPLGDVRIDLTPFGSPQPKMVLSGALGRHELQVVTLGRDDRDQFRDLQILAATNNTESRAKSR